MHRRTRGVVRRGSFALAALAIAATAQAQRPSTRRPATTRRNQITVVDARWTGFMLGVQTIAAPGVTITGNDIDGTFKTNFGPGAGVMVGYGFNRTVSAFASLDLAKQGTGMDDFQGSFGLSHLEAGIRANLSFGDAATVPYVSASIGRRGLGARVTDGEEGQTYDMKMSGGMFGLGGGVQHALSPTLAMDGGLELGFGRFAHVQQGGGNDSGAMDVNGSTTVRLRIGMIWRPNPRPRS